MPSIKLKSLTFDQHPFRKLRNITIPIAERITIIAGHNGIGKSTILGLIANGSGIRHAPNKSYFNRAFEANLSEIVHLDYEKEFEAYKDNGAQLPSPTIEYKINGEKLFKRCTITNRKERREVRVVPRNDPHEEMNSKDGTVQVGPDAKVPLPTLYLGMTRMLPVGESPLGSVTSSPDESIHPDDAAFIKSFTDKVIGTGYQSDEPVIITTQSIKGTRKTSKHPGYSHSAKCVSLGQDSLSAIATVLASFKKLQRELAEDYLGGLLVIDELDAGFHPHAQVQLVRALASAARTLNLQILATTHSVLLIEAIHPDTNPVGPSGKYVDAVVYLTDTRTPRVAENYSFKDIQGDMSLIPPSVTPHITPRTLKIYLEDPEAHFVIERLLTSKLKRRVKREAGVKLKAIPLSVGCENLKGFHKHDPYFRTVLIALDADASITRQSKNTRNIIKLPGGVGSNKKGLPPEGTIHAFITELASNSSKYPYSQDELIKMKVTSDHLYSHLLTGVSNINDRASAKKWMSAKLKHIRDWKLVELWLLENPNQVKKFEDALVAAAIATAKLT
jgi:predicted ATPase